MCFLVDVAPHGQGQGSQRFGVVDGALSAFQFPLRMMIDSSVPPDELYALPIPMSSAISDHRLLVMHSFFVGMFLIRCVAVAVAQKKRLFANFRPSVP